VLNGWMKGLYKRSLGDLVVFYRTYPIVGFMIFFMSYFLLVRGILQVRKKVRFHVSQALIIYLLTSIIGSLLNALPEMILMGWFGSTCLDILFILTMGSVIYASYQVWNGELTRLPLISEAAKLQVQDGEGEKK
jgi:uncharacterized membrane protein